MPTLGDIVLDIQNRIEELERRMENRRRTGLVHSVDLKAGTARVKIDEDPVTKAPYLSPPIPWKEQRMGHIRTHAPPAVGEQVVLVSESGDITEAVIDTSLPSNAFKRPSDKDEWKVQVGNSSITVKDGEITIETPHKKTKAGRIDYEQDKNYLSPPPGPPKGVPAADIPSS